jgi:hypothetical protein
VDTAPTVAMGKGVGEVEGLERPGTGHVGSQVEKAEPHVLHRGMKELAVWFGYAIIDSRGEIYGPACRAQPGG